MKTDITYTAAIDIAAHTLYEEVRMLRQLLDQHGFNEQTSAKIIYTAVDRVLADEVRPQ